MTSITSSLMMWNLKVAHASVSAVTTLYDIAGERESNMWQCKPNKMNFNIGVITNYNELGASVEIATGIKKLSHSSFQFISFVG